MQHPVVPVTPVPSILKSPASASVPQKDRPLEGQVALITGASRGIGREIAITFAAAGASVVIAAKSTQSQANLPGTIFDVAREIEKAGGRALPVKCDVRSDTDLQNVVDTTMKVFGRVDILICNAGALWWKDVLETPLKRYDLLQEVNSRATFALCQAVLPHMLNQKHGHIIVMSPPIDLDMLKGKVAYCISKFGMTMTVLGLADEVRGTGVAINALWPATLVESYATINHQLGDRSNWRKASIIADASLMIAREDPYTFTKQTLIDEDYMRSRGIRNFKKYRCDPSVKPSRIIPAKLEHVGDVSLKTDPSNPNHTKSNL